MCLPRSRPRPPASLQHPVPRRRREASQARLAGLFNVCVSPPRSVAGAPRGPVRQLCAVAYFQELISYDIISKNAGIPFLGNPFPVLEC